jgi:hypothetical protein
LIIDEVFPQSLSIPLFISKLWGPHPFFFACDSHSPIRRTLWSAPAGFGSKIASAQPPIELASERNPHRQWCPSSSPAGARRTTIARERGGSTRWLAGKQRGGGRTAHATPLHWSAAAAPRRGLAGAAKCEEAGQVNASTSRRDSCTYPWAMVRAAERVLLSGGPCRRSASSSSTSLRRRRPVMQVATCLPRRSCSVLLHLPAVRAPPCGADDRQRKRRRVLLDGPITSSTSTSCCATSTSSRCRRAAARPPRWPSVARRHPPPPGTRRGTTNSMFGWLTAGAGLL